jgi:hypothetical protein
VSHRRHRVQQSGESSGWMPMSTIVDSCGFGGLAALDAAVREPGDDFLLDEDRQSSTGSVTMIAAAASGPTTTARTSARCNTATGSVRVSRPASTAPNTKLFHEKMNARIVRDDDPGPRERQRDVAERRPDAAAVDHRRFLELLRQRLEVAGHDVDDDRHRDDEVRDHQRRQRVVEARNWNTANSGSGRRAPASSGEQDQHGELLRADARDAEAGGDADRSAISVAPPETTMLFQR